MYPARRKITITFSMVAALATLLSSFALVPFASADSGGGGYAPHQIHVNPLYSKTDLVDAAHFGCQDRPLGGTRARCYNPQQIQNAYNITPLLNAGLNGTGRTIVIVDAFSNPYIQSDLHIFDQITGLPDPNFQVIAPFGQTPFDFTDGNQIGWSAEIALDVQWAHAVAPGANIILALALTNNDVDILNTTKWVVDHNLGDVISQSFGEAEACMDPKLLKDQHKVFKNATKRHITLIASSGDQGAAQPTCDGSAFMLSSSTPASDPFVLAVGGTTLMADSNTGAYGFERAWADAFSGGCNPPAQFGCSGGGFSNIFNQPSYQENVKHTRDDHRGVPDVAYNGGVDGGVVAHWGVGLQVLVGIDPNTPAFFIFGGTSAGSPQWAGITAIADQAAGKRLGWLNPAVYRIGQSDARYAAAFHDITSGNNNFPTVAGYQTNDHWDAVTGWGTPNVANLVPMLSRMHDDGEDNQGDNRNQ